MLEFIKTNAIVMMQHAFRTPLDIDLLHHKSIRQLALTNDNKVMQRTFCESMVEMAEDKAFFSFLVFSNEVIFHLSGKVNCHNVHICGAHPPHEVVKHQKDFPKLDIFCAVPQGKVYDLFFFEGHIVTGSICLQMVQDWLFSLPQADSNDFIFQQDGDCTIGILGFELI